MDLSVLLTLPLESIAIRAFLAAAACVLLVRLLLRAGLRVPGARVATAVAPAVTLVAVGVLTWGSLRLPSLMLPVDAADVALPIRVHDGYLHFAPMAVPLLVGVWWLVAGSRLSRRGVAIVRARRRARAALRDGSSSPQLVAMTARLAGALRVPAPAVAVIADCPGGALVVGSRRPVVVVGEQLLTRLDEDELEGVLAHELAHVKRRDNLVATLVGMVRDLAFFVPGGGWAVRQLHRERELAADQVAVRVTGRPGALAGGLLKVLEKGHGPAHPCAALVPSGSLVDRVRVLVEDQPRLSPVRHGAEVVGVASSVAVALVLALVLPTALTGADRQREAVALMWSSTAGQAGEEAPLVAEPRAFDVYRRSSLEVQNQPAVAVRARDDERSVENRPSTWRACADEHATCPAPSQRVGLGLRPQQPVITVDAATTRSWRATPVVSGTEAGDGFQLFWLARIE